MLCASELRCEAVLKCCAVVHVAPWSVEALQGLAMAFELPEALAACAAQAAGAAPSLGAFVAFVEKHLELLSFKREQNRTQRQLLQAAIVKLQAAPEMLRDLERPKRKRRLKREELKNLRT